MIEVIARSKRWCVTCAQGMKNRLAIWTLEFARKVKGAVNRAWRLGFSLKLKVKSNKAAVLVLGLFAFPVDLNSYVTTYYPVIDAVRVNFSEKVLDSNSQEKVSIYDHLNETIKERLVRAKIEALDFKIPSSSQVEVKFLSIPELNRQSDSIVTSVSPIRDAKTGRVFDGADCRLGLKSIDVNKSQKATFNVHSVSCTDNEGYAYTLENDRPMGYLSEKSEPRKSKVNVIDYKEFPSINPNVNYIVNLYEPLSHIKNVGVSFVGRF
ncbi:hypothetical protein [Vibrio rotiferianus]|uniref:hypothetical protein n=1 Tax=Vibrio rotiferianus TaxID=190895 RepID=UPI0005F02DEB|nr:hypothetical protein [Vibrio rotiferianus]